MSTHSLESRIDRIEALLRTTKPSPDLPIATVLTIWGPDVAIRHGNEQIERARMKPAQKRALNCMLTLVVDTCAAHQGDPEKLDARALLDEAESGSSSVRQWVELNLQKSAGFSLNQGADFSAEFFFGTSSRLVRPKRHESRNQRLIGTASALAVGAVLAALLFWRGNPSAEATPQLTISKASPQALSALPMAGSVPVFSPPGEFVQEIPEAPGGEQ